VRLLALVACLLLLPCAEGQDPPSPSPFRGAAWQGFGGQDGPEAVIAEMQKRADDSQIEQVGWRVFSKFNAGHLSQAFGLELLGRFHRAEGVRTMSTNLSCGDAAGELKAPGPNHYVVVWGAEALTIAPIMLMIESPKPEESFPFLIFRSKRGEPGHDEVEPTLMPTTIETIFWINEPAIQFQLAPRIMFGHEPNLKAEARAKFAGRECVVLSSWRDGRALLPKMPYEWSTLATMRKRFYIDPETWLLAGMDFEILRQMPANVGGSKQESWRIEVKKRHAMRGNRAAKPLELPLETEMTDAVATAGGGHRHTAVIRREMEFQEGEFP